MTMLEYNKMPSVNNGIKPNIMVLPLVLPHRSVFYIFYHLLFNSNKYLQSTKEKYIYIGLCIFFLFSSNLS